MSFEWSQLLTWRMLANVLDIIVVWYFVYKLIMLIRGTKAVQLFKGIIVIALIKVISWYIGLRTVSYIMDQFISWIVIALIVIFQPEIRRGLEHIGRGSLLRRGVNPKIEQENNLIKALDKSIQYMSKRRIGALITIQMNTGLEDYIETGIDLDADVTGELLINIFIPNTPLHDGAVIIRDDKIAVAAAYLPLSESNLIPKELGTRHRAAVGISEVTDALTIVVSEETGGVTLTRNNELMRDLSRDDYMKYFNSHLITQEENKTSLLQEFVDGFKKRRPEMMKKFVEGPWLYRILALFLALLLFGYVNLDEINTTRQTNNNDTQMLATRTETVKVPLQINADTDRYFITGYPQKVKVKLSGPNALVTSAVNTLNFRVIGDLTKLGPGDHTVKLKQTGINKDIKVTIEPKEIKVHIEHKVTKQFPVQVNVKKENLAAGYSLGNPKLSQDVVEVSGAKSAVNAVSQVVATVDPDEGTKKRHQ